jgi:hypothetical protein
MTRVLGPGRLFDTCPVFPFPPLANQLPSVCVCVRVCPSTSTLRSHSSRVTLLMMQSLSFIYVLAQLEQVFEKSIALRPSGAWCKQVWRRRLALAILVTLFGIIITHWTTIGGCPSVFGHLKGNKYFVSKNTSCSKSLCSCQSQDR